MVIAAYLADCRGRGAGPGEPLLLCLDASLYLLLAVICAHAVADDFCAAANLYLTVAVCVNAPRHIATRRAACNQNATSEGQLTMLPCAITAEKDADKTLWPWLPVVALCLSTMIPDPAARSLLALLGAELHFITCRVHGDCRGGKPAPTLFCLLLHVAATLSGAPTAVSLSLHRMLIVWTYFLTGFRKLYCVGLRWADGANLQLMLGIQGLYHDGSNGWNLALMRYRGLCRLCSVAVVGLQLALPLSLALPPTSPYAALARSAGFLLAMSFHAANHILWRINFFVAWCPALLALLARGEQLSASALWHDSPPAPLLVVIVYVALQLGHALDLTTEKCLAHCRNALLAHGDGAAGGGAVSSRSLVGSALRATCLRAIWLLEFHLLGDYYSSYWPSTHPLRGEPVACAILLRPDGTEALLPAPTDFYWRRDMSSGVKWPRSADGLCEVKAWVGWSDAKGNTGGALHATTARAEQAPPLRRPVGDVLRALERQLEGTFLGPRALRRLKRERCALVLRARAIEAKGASLVVNNLWECKLEL